MVVPIRATGDPPGFDFLPQSQLFIKSPELFPFSPQPIAGSSIFFWTIGFRHCNISRQRSKALTDKRLAKNELISPLSVRFIAEPFFLLLFPI